MISKWKYVWWPLAFVNWSREMLRNRLFDLGVWKSVEFEVPVVYVGSLADDVTAGVSKYIQNLTHGLLHVHRFRLPEYDLRKKKDTSNIYAIPLNLENTFCTKHKVLGLSECYQNFPGASAFVMDGEFGKNEIRPLLRVMVTNYESPFHLDTLFPVGNLKESRTAAKRADIVLVGQTPEHADCGKMEEVLRAWIKPEASVFFIRNTIESLKSFKSAEQIEFISDRHNFERLILNVLPNANPDSE